MVDELSDDLLVVVQRVDRIGNIKRKLSNSNQSEEKRRNREKALYVEEQKLNKERFKLCF